MNSPRFKKLFLRGKYFLPKIKKTLPMYDKEDYI